MTRHFVADNVPGSERDRFWAEAVSTVLFPLESRPDNVARFSGILHDWDMGEASLSYFRSGPVFYRRERRHLATDKDEEILVSFSGRSDLLFTQNDTTVVCGGKQFVVQRGHAPYEFHQTDDNELLVLKMPVELLKQKVRSVDRYSSLAFDSNKGAGGLLYDTLRLLPRRIRETSDAARQGLANCVVDLLVLALEGDERVLHSGLTSVRTGHLTRIEHYIRRNLGNRHLSPELIAECCEISVRYLHQLFGQSGTSVSQWVRELRLQACHRQLREARQKETVAEIAYRWGFADQAQFSRHFKARFGCTAKEMRAEAANMRRPRPASGGS